MNAPETTVSPAVELVERSLEALDFPALLAVLARGSASGAGQEAVLALRPSDSLPLAQLRMQRVGAVLALRDAGHPLPRASFAGIAELGERIRRGASASGSELLGVLSVLVQARELRVFAAAHRHAQPVLFDVLSSDAALDRVASRLEACLEPSGEVADSASERLGQARERVRETERELRQLLKRLVSRHSDVLSGEYFAEREGLYVLPVRADAHRRVEGRVVGSSGSGNTLFVEPSEVAALGDRLRVRQAEVERETARVLSELVHRIETELDEVLVAFEACIAGDVLGALADWAVSSRSLPLPVRADPKLVLQQARHPLLASAPHVVANDLTLSAGQALVVSGPNAGGKTVVLKTLGLFAVMARSGIPLPCEAESSVGFFDVVLADIGDQQSLVQSLSTFSGHIRKLSSILELAGPASLVLLDEALAGTDPGEGAALAGAVLEALVEQGAGVAVTTHYERLKEQAAAPGALTNACVGFDFVRMEPTFRVTLGAFGPSSALLVAARYGLPPSVIARARELLPAEALEREHVAQEQEAERQRLASEREELETVRHELVVERRRIEAEKERLATQGRLELQRESRALLAEVHKARQELRQARQRLRTTPQEKGEVKAIEREVSRVAAAVALGGPLASTLTATPTSQEDSRAEIRASVVAAGDEVRVLSNGARGTVLSSPSRGSVEVRVGSLRMKLPLSGVQPVAGRRASDERKRAPSARELSRVPTPGEPDRARRTSDNTLDLRGTRVEDAGERLEAFVDRLLGEGEDFGFVLHGHGSGALRSAVRAHLETLSWVAFSAPADKDEGGDAFTMFRIGGH